MRNIFSSNAIKLHLQPRYTGHRHAYTQFGDPAEADDPTAQVFLVAMIRLSNNRLLHVRVNPHGCNPPFLFPIAFRNISQLMMA
jgi:hypothetical protein